MTSVVDGLRMPPHHIEAEQSVLGGLMLAADAYDRISDWLHEDDFYRKDHRLIFRAIRELIERKTPCDAVTLADWFGDNGLAEMIGGMSYLIELANNTPSAANIVAYAEIVAEKSKLRRSIDIGQQLQEGAWAPGAEAAQVAAVASEQLSELSSSSQRSGLLGVKGALQEYWKDAAASLKSGPQLLGLATPWNSVNEALCGLEPATVYVVAARPNMGKSAFAYQLLGHVAMTAGSAAGFTLESSAKRGMTRMIASFGRLPFNFARQPDSDPRHEEYWPRMTNAIAQLNAAPILIDDTPGISIEQFEARVRRAHKQTPLKFVFLDHIHTMALDPDREQRHEYGRIIRRAKVIAHDLNIPIVLFAQLSRALEQRSDKRPRMSDIRESGELEQEADVILFLYREDYYEKGTHLAGIVEVIVGKGRDIETGKTIYLANRFDQMRLENYDGLPPEPPRQQQQKGGWGSKRGND